jgi:hypothetical protein
MKKIVKEKSSTYSYMDNSELEVRIRGSDDRCHNKTNQRSRHCTYNNIYWNIPPANMQSVTNKTGKVTKCRQLLTRQVPPYHTRKAFYKYVSEWK